KAAGPHSEGRPSVFGLFDETQDPKSSDETKCVGIRDSDHPTSPRKPCLASPLRCLDRWADGTRRRLRAPRLSAPPRQCPPHPPRFNGFGASGLPSTPGSRFRSLGYFFVAYSTFLFWVTICCPCDTYHL
ncbi:unnamed protein product, partial [Musa acuminata subsp. burmannicoides]